MLISTWDNLTRKGQILSKVCIIGKIKKKKKIEEEERLLKVTLYLRCDV